VLAAIGSVTPKEADPMEILLAIIIFGLMAAFTIYGFLGSQKVARGEFGSRGASLAMSGGESVSGGGSSPGRKTEDHATLSEVAEPVGAKAEKPATKSTGPGEQRPQAERPLTSGDVGA
jgi:hypothetical protein